MPGGGFTAFKRGVAAPPLTLVRAVLGLVAAEPERELTFSSSSSESEIWIVAVDARVDDARRGGAIWVRR